MKQAQYVWVKGKLKNLYLFFSILFKIKMLKRREVHVSS